MVLFRSQESSRASSRRWSGASDISQTMLSERFRAGGRGDVLALNGKLQQSEAGRHRGEGGGGRRESACRFPKPSFLSSTKTLGCYRDADLRWRQRRRRERRRGRRGGGRRVSGKEGKGGGDGGREKEGEGGGEGGRGGRGRGGGGGKREGGGGREGGERGEEEEGVEGGEVRRKRIGGGEWITCYPYTTEL